MGKVTCRHAECPYPLTCAIRRKDMDEWCWEPVPSTKRNRECEAGTCSLPRQCLVNGACLNPYKKDKPMPQKIEPKRKCVHTGVDCLSPGYCGSKDTCADDNKAVTVTKPTMPPKPDGSTPYTQEQKRLRIQLTAAALQGESDQRTEVKWTVHRALNAASVLEAYFDRGQQDEDS